MDQGGRDRLLDRLLARTDSEASALTARERALLGYAEKLTLDPGSVCADDVEQLRAAGLGDRAVHDACAIVAYFAFVNRVADGLGVELEDEARAHPRGTPRADGA